MKYIKLFDGREWKRETYNIVGLPSGQIIEVSGDDLITLAEEGLMLDSNPKDLPEFSYFYDRDYEKIRFMLNDTVFEELEIYFDEDDWDYEEEEPIKLEYFIVKNGDNYFIASKTDESGKNHAGYSVQGGFKLYKNGSINQTRLFDNSISEYEIIDILNDKRLINIYSLHQGKNKNMWPYSIRAGSHLVPFNGLPKEVKDNLFTYYSVIGGQKMFLLLPEIPKKRSIKDRLLKFRKRYGKYLKENIDIDWDDFDWEEEDEPLYGSNEPIGSTDYEKFEIGDIVNHPMLGDGVITKIIKREGHGNRGNTKFKISFYDRNVKDILPVLTKFTKVGNHNVRLNEDIDLEDTDWEEYEEEKYNGDYYIIYLSTSNNSYFFRKVKLVYDFKSETYLILDLGKRKIRECGNWSDNNIKSLLKNFDNDIILFKENDINTKKFKDIYKKFFKKNFNIDILKKMKKTGFIEKKEIKKWDDDEIWDRDYWVKRYDWDDDDEIWDRDYWEHGYWG